MMITWATITAWSTSCGLTCDDVARADKRFAPSLQFTHKQTKHALFNGLIHKPSFYNLHNFTSYYGILLTDMGKGVLAFMY